MPLKVWPNTALGCNHQFACPSYSLYVQLLRYPMYYPEGMKARVSPVQWSKPNSILAPTQDSNPGGRIQNHKRWPLHYHCTTLPSSYWTIYSFILRNYFRRRPRKNNKVAAGSQGFSYNIRDGEPPRKQGPRNRRSLGEDRHVRLDQIPSESQIRRSSRAFNRIRIDEGHETLLPGQTFQPWMDRHRRIACSPLAPTPRNARFNGNRPVGWKGIG